MNQTTIAMVDGLYEIAEYMEDKELSQALEFIAKIILKPDIPPHVATLEIVRLQAIAAKMQMRATWMAMLIIRSYQRKTFIHNSSRAR